MNRLTRVCLRLLSWRNSLAYYADCGLNEDILLGLLAPRVVAGFRVASPALAARFSIDADPKYFFARYLEAGCLPFGCHAWQKCYHEFWRPMNCGLPSLAEPDPAEPEPFVSQPQ
jgi:hypothetical protein